MLTLTPITFIEYCVKRAVAKNGNTSSIHKNRNKNKKRILNNKRTIPYYSTIYNGSYTLHILYVR